MFEILKLLWDVVALRDAARRGQYDWRIWPMAFVAVAVLFGVALAAEGLYEKHPEYKPLCIAAGVLDLVFFAGFVVWASRWQSRLAAAKAGRAS